MKMILRDRIDWLKQRIAGAASIQSLLDALDELQRLEPDQEDGEELDNLRLQAFDALARLTQDAPSEAGPIILHRLLPLCLRTKGEWHVPRVAQYYDETLSSWLDRFPAPHRFPLRGLILDALGEALAEGKVERACRLIGRLGYRDERAFNRLLDLARAGADSIPDVALRTLTALGVPHHQHATLVKLWFDRASAVPWNHDLIGAAKQLASAEILGLVFDRWLIGENLAGSDAERRVLAHLVMAVSAAVAERSPSDAELQDRVWDRLQMLEPMAPDLFFSCVLGGTQVAQPCDTPGVVRFYLSTLKGDERTQNLAYFRLEECERPRQLLGWEDPGEEVIRCLLQDAVAARTMVGSFVTQKLRRKLHTWQTLLSLGRSEVLAQVEDAVANESNGYAVEAILDLAACFQLDPLPSRVKDLIAGDFGDIGADDSGRVSSHVSAIAVARASGSFSALETLLAFNLIREGGVLLRLLDALTDTATTLLQAGEDRAAEILWQAASPGQPDHRRTAAAAALGRLVRRNLLHPLPVDRLVSLIQDETLDRYAAREILDGLGYLPPDEVPSAIVQALRGVLTASPPTANSNGEPWGIDFRPVTLGTLARLGVLASEPDTIRQYLGLRPEGATWRCDVRPVLPGVPVIVGILYAKQPGPFTPAVADLVREGDWTAVVQLAPFLRSGPLPAPEPILDAIHERVRRAGPDLGEPDLVPLLADLAPDRITSVSWSGMFSWPPQVRAAIAGALTRSPAPGDPDRRVNLLLVLMGDPQYGVRRAAFRAMARISPEGLHSICTAWALLTEAKVQPAEVPYVIDMRRRAAEAAAWLEPVPVEGPVADLACDPEPEVRATFARCQRERLNRDWARGYLDHVLAARDNPSLLAAWKYGRALERVGDDEVLERLEERRQEDLPSGIRHWFGRLIKKVRSRWDEVTRGWPEPWFARRGQLERVDATVGDNGATANPVSCWLWQVPPSDLVDHGVWGGWCPEAALPTDLQALRIPGRQPATILVTRTTGWGTGPTYFVGSGPYPEPVA
jgi:hypothetical protein